MMNKATIGFLVVVGLGISVVLMAKRGLERPVTQPLAEADAGTGPVYTITNQFTAELLNSRMLQSDAFRLNPGDSLTHSVDIIRHTFRPNRFAQAVLHGNAAKTPVGWAYVELVNATPQPQSLVLSMPQYRCNQATLFVGRVGPGLVGQFNAVGTLQNTTPIGQRFFPFISFAFPFTLRPHERLPLLLRTQSRVGFHEVAVQLSQRSVYAETALSDSIRDGLQVIVFLILAVVALLIGWLSDSRLLRLYGLHLASLCGTCLCLAGYLCFLPYPDWLSINADTIGTIGRLVINITVHPFFYQVIKPAIRNQRRYKQAVLGLCAANALFIGLHLLPFRYYDAINYATNLGMVSLSLVNIGWIIYFSMLAWQRAGIWSVGVACLIIFGPLLASQMLSLVQAADGQDTYRQPAVHPLLIILALSYLTFEQFRKELVTKRRLQTQVKAVQEDLNRLRRQEIDRIGRDLHDQVGNTLATALGYLSRLPTDTQQPRAIIVNAISELRFLSHNLVKDDERPLTEKVDTLVNRFNDFAVMPLTFADYTHKQIDILPALKQQHLYSIIQELMTNLVRHSQATQASVQFFCDGTTVDISVEDDGVGFARSSSERSGGIGIENIHKRAALANIEVRFDPAPTGTTVILTTLLHDPNPHHSH